MKRSHHVRVRDERSPSPRSLGWPPISIGRGRILLTLNQSRSVVVVPFLTFTVWVCAVESTILLAEKVFMGSVSLLEKILRRRSGRIYPCAPLVEDEELGTAAYPMVIVQIPMYNEKEVYHLSIGAACSLQWPADRLVVQVLDDSTAFFSSGVLQDLVQKCQKWLAKGVDLTYETRGDRRGYKAGALEGMKLSYFKECDYVAIFDADFQPESDFLIRTVPLFALVQARWKFVKANECLMTRMQEMSMDYHFKVEQESGSSAYAFFGFNGTAGVWRTHAINEAGGWKDRTTVEDMDLAIRATLLGWKFIYLGDVKVPIPSTFKAYRNQQHRWSCEPETLVWKIAMEIVNNKFLTQYIVILQKVSLWRKFYLMYNFFLVRRIIFHLVTFCYSSIVIPTLPFFPEVQIPFWSIGYIPIMITLLNCVGTPRSIHLVVLSFLFENVMSLHPSKVVIIGLLEVGRVNEWVVTKKLGPNPNMSQTGGCKFSWNAIAKYFTRFHLLELGVGIYLVVCTSYNYAHHKNYYFIFIYLQSLAFIIVGVGYVGIFIPNSK
ncbi:unnamed protein product [Spirodela intermedia]|uniref:glucomannan 4-beta-mannosyltransferase n=1 Tax=Spirodela intermedia TaxID=51605 RepID=A0A7I8JXQ4_SPIIN|nr:unnamed protein product [Spirodela intermedia]